VVDPFGGHHIINDQHGNALLPVQIDPFLSSLCRVNKLHQRSDEIR